MNFFFDNNLPRSLADAIAALSNHEPAVKSVIHKSDRFAPNTAGIEWISALASSSERWYVVSIDGFRKDHRAQRIAISRAGHTVYVLDAQWSSQMFWAKAARLVLWWPLVLEHARLSRGGVYRVPWAHTSQSRFHAA